jgi:hypothetical protein
MVMYEVYFNVKYEFSFPVYNYVYNDQFNILLNTAVDEWQLFSCTTLNDWSLLMEMALFLCERDGVSLYVQYNINISPQIFNCSEI